MSSHVESARFSVRRAEWRRHRAALQQVRTLVFIEEQRRGFEIAGDEIIKAGIPHRRMILHN